MKKNQKKKKKTPTKKSAAKKTMNKKTVLIIVAAVVVAAVLAGLGIYALVSRNHAESAEWKDVEVNSRVDGAADMLTDDAEEDAADSDNAEEDAEAENEDGEASESDSAGGNESAGYAGNSDNGNSGNSGGNSSQSGTVNVPDIPTISFPYAIPNTDLVVEQISSYSGYFIEDGSDQEVSGIAAIVLTNNGGDLDFVGIGISEDDRSLAFSASQVPAGSSIIIQEQNMAAYMNGNYYSCTATTTESAGFGLAEDSVVLNDNGDNSFDVSNIGEATIPEVKVYFKNYLPDEDVYVGGITYSVTLTDIEPQTAVTVTPGHYDSNYSEFIDVVTGAVTADVAGE